MAENISDFSRILPEQWQKGGNGHRLVTLKCFSRGELLSLSRYYIKSPIDITYRGFLSNLDASIPTSMLVEVGGGIFSTKFLIPNYDHDDSLGPCTFIHHISTFFPPRSDMRWLINGKFRGVTAKVDDFASI